jgi:hypothetical protein
MKYAKPRQSAVNTGNSPAQGRQYFLLGAKSVALGTRQNNIVILKAADQILHGRGVVNKQSLSLRAECKSRNIFDHETLSGWNR